MTYIYMVRVAAHLPLGLGTRLCGRLCRRSSGAKRERITYSGEKGKLRVVPVR
jgi:hypothetical protein